MFCIKVIISVKYVMTCKSMERITYLEAVSCTSCQQIVCFLWNPKNHYRTHKSLPLVPIQSHKSPHTLLSIIFNIRCNIICEYTNVFAKWSFALRFPTKI